MGALFASEEGFGGFFIQRFAANRCRPFVDIGVPGFGAAGGLVGVVVCGPLYYGLTIAIWPSIFGGVSSFAITRLFFGVYYIDVFLQGDGSYVNGSMAFSNNYS